MAPEEAAAERRRQSAQVIVGQGRVGSTMSLRETLQQMAQHLKIPVDVMRQAYDIFTEHAKCPDERQSQDVEHTFLFEALLSHSQFAEILCALTSIARPEELPEDLLNSCFITADSSMSRMLDFSEFAVWFSRYGFNENMLLSDEQRDLRMLARRHGIPITTVEKYKAKFDTFDLDGSSKIEFGEFERLLYVLLRIPDGLDLPSSRVRQFWSDSGPNAEGGLGFEEFLLFYTRHFVHDSESLHPFQGFYRGLRRVPIRCQTTR